MWCKCSRGIQALLLSTHQCEELDKRFFLQQGLITFQGRSLLLEESALPKFGVGKKRDRGSGREKNGVEDGAI